MDTMLKPEDLKRGDKLVCGSLYATVKEVWFDQKMVDLDFGPVPFGNISAFQKVSTRQFRKAMKATK